MDELYQKLGGGTMNMWGDYGSTNETTFMVTESWLEHSSGTIKTTQRRISHEKFKSWLSEEKKESGDKAQSLVLRLAWLDVDVKNRRINLSDAVKDELVDAFDLRLAYGYAQSCITNITAFPPSNGHQTYSFCYVPKIAAVWSHRRFNDADSSARPFLTQGLIFVQDSPKKSEEDEKKNVPSPKEMLIKLLNTPWNNCLYGSPLLPCFIFSLLLSAQIHRTEEAIKFAIQRIERHTGHHNFANRYEQAATQANGRLAAEANGYATRLASVNRKSKLVERVLRFMVEKIGVEEILKPNTGWPYLDACQFLRQHAAVLQDRLEMQSVDTEYTLKRVQIQISALAGIITREDVKANHDMSKSQREIAMHSYRDSSSMKTLAIVTMVFLPGSFVSALFSTSMFDWDGVSASSDSIGLDTKPQFKLYWAITIPLTAITFLLYFLWLILLKRQRDYRMTEVVSEDDDADELSIGKGDVEAGETGRHRKPQKGTALTNKSSWSMSW